MKNNPILGLQGLKKMLKSMSFLALSLMVFSADARNRVNTSPRGVSRNVKAQAVRKQISRTPAPLVGGGPAANQTTLADQVAWVLQQSVPWSDEANRVLADIYPKISPEQKAAIGNYYDKQTKLNKFLEKKEKDLAKLQRQVQYLQQKINVQPIGAIQPTTEKEKGWIHWLTGYDTSKLTPEQGVALGAAGAIGTGIAAVTAGVWLPALGAFAAWMGPVGMAKLAGTTYGVNAIRFALKTGAITVQGAIDSRKNMLQMQLTGGMYPTLELQQEVLVGDGRLELLAVGEDINNDIFTRACSSMLAELKALDQKLNETEKQLANKINVAVVKCRTEYDKATVSLQDYLGDIAENISAQNIAEILAYASEYQRAQNQIGLGIAARLEKERAEAIAAAEKAQQELEKARQAAEENAQEE